MSESPWPTLHVMRIPIACTLQPSDARSQLGEWQNLLNQVTERTERVSPNRLELALTSDADIGSLISLAQREAACCTFFSFSIDILVDRLDLVVTVPDDAVEILDQLVSTTAT